MEPRRVGPGAHCWGPRVAAGSGTAAELVYYLAGALGTELKELARRFGPEAAAGLVPLVVQALELLEKAAVGPAPDSLQEQLQRLLLVNAELRHKLAAVQTHLRAARDRESESERRREATLEPAPEQAQGQAAAPGCEQRQQPETAAAGTGAPETHEDRVDALPPPGRPPKVGQCGFSREEVEQILQERNELKANVFLLKEELAYFQRELLTDHRVPGLLLEAMKVAIRKQRKKIKAKMLGTPEEAESSDDEDGSWLLLSRDKGDHLQPPPPESRIQSFLGLWYRGETEAPEAEAGIAATSEVRGGEEAPQPPHLEPVGSLTAPNS
ncbi:rab-interacting lysosomal protein isoform X2 [Balaenoptera musculus]|uniref:Rab-interacting lysosomal protein n=1 Tax=Balaenoptera musculus TaxID=9771 RepID=A0A8B8WAQ6_BALMU|nr:rab-interacting lysosomal protein isoform X2 [Balaenoptera musculus]